MHLFPSQIMIHAVRWIVTDYHRMNCDDRTDILWQSPRYMLNTQTAERVCYSPEHYLFPDFGVKPQTSDFRSGLFCGISFITLWLRHIAP